MSADVVLRIKAIACDLDGTLARHGTVPFVVRAALTRVRTCGVVLVLVTARNAHDLQRSFPGLMGRFDAVVAENGACLSIPGSLPRRLAPAVDPGLIRAMIRRRISHDKGECIVSCSESSRGAVDRLIADLRLDVRTTVNRHRVTVLPSGISRATGVQVALRLLGVSRHNLAVVGDGEDDLPMFDLAQLAVAAADGLESVRARAHVVLRGRGADGLVAFLDRIAENADWADASREDRVRIGSEEDGSAVSVSAAPDTNLLIDGPRGAGKSYLTGLLVEKWCELDYRCLVIDLEGDHMGLGSLRDTVVLSADQPPDETDLVRLLRCSQLSVVVDLSPVTEQARVEFLSALPGIVRRVRAEYGVPHWVVRDDARTDDGSEGIPATDDSVRAGESGYLLVSRRHTDSTEAGPVINVWMNARKGVDGAVSLVQIIDQLHGRHEFVPATRSTTHLRHWDTYPVAVLAPDQWFWFTDPATGQEDACARNVQEFAELLATVAVQIVQHHLRRGDFSRWLEQLGEDALAQLLSTVEEVADLGPDGVVVGTPARISTALRRVLWQRADGSPTGPRQRGTLRTSPAAEGTDTAMVGSAPRQLAPLGP